jgi:hypothetical protein
MTKLLRAHLLTEALRVDGDDVADAGVMSAVGRRLEHIGPLDLEIITH